MLVDTVLYASHSRALTLLYSEIETAALGRREVFLGTAGSVLERSNAGGFRFFAHQYYGADGKKKEHYVAGPVGDGEAEVLADALRTKIREVKDLVPSLRLLGREGFAMSDVKTYATIASLHNHRWFERGGLLVGSHAYGVILNRLGVRAAAWSTTDIDVVRAKKLVLENADGGFLAILRESGIGFVEVPEWERTAPSTSFKEAGRSAFAVDLLVPGDGERARAVEVPELKAHAAALPHLGYLVEDSQDGVLLSREGCCAVRIPLPERFAVHKIIVAGRRAGAKAKSDKDVLQAAVLAAVLSETQSGALAGAVAALTPAGRRAFLRARGAVEKLLIAHPRAIEELQ